MQNQVADAGADAGNEQPADARECLRPAHGQFALAFVGEQLGKPSYRRDEFHAYADKRRAAKEDQPREAVAEAGKDRREGIDEDTARHY